MRTAAFAMALLAAGPLLPAAAQDVSPPPREIDMVRAGSVLIARHEVTRGEWKSCHDDGGCSFLPFPASAPLAPAYPVTGINLHDALEYIAWMNARSGLRYRLPSALEWRTAAAGLPRPAHKKLFTDPRLAWAADYGAMGHIPSKLRPSGSFGRLSNGIADLGGNVWEWTSSCAISVSDLQRCPSVTIEGAHEMTLAVRIRKPASGGCAAGAHPSHMGFRLAMDSSP